ncbi:unnamed protein product [Sphagnum balticum]
MHRTGATIFPHHIPNLRRPKEKPKLYTEVVIWYKVMVEGQPNPCRKILLHRFPPHFTRCCIIAKQLTTPDTSRRSAIASSSKP